MQKNILILISTAFLLVANTASAWSVPQVNIDFEVVPPGPQDPGEQYEVKATVKIGDSACQNCPIEWYFKDQGPGDDSMPVEQPGDELLPHSTVTNEGGEAMVTTISYAPNRVLVAKVTLKDGSPAVGEVTLPYKDRPLLGFIKLVSFYVGKGYVLPPLGNILAKATRQVYKGGDTREIFLEWNNPFGTKRFDVYAYNLETTKVDPIYSSKYGAEGEKTYLVKSTHEAETSVSVPAFENVGIRVRACTSRENCVDSPPIRVTKITDPRSAAESESLAIPNYGLGSPSGGYETSLKEEESFFQQFFGPVLSWLKGLYALFR